MAVFRPVSAEQEREWLDGLRAGRMEVYRTVFETFVPELWNFACLSVPRDVADDVVQEVMFDLWRRRNALDIDAGGLAPYLFGAVRNRTSTYHRHERVVERAERDAAVSDDPPGMSGAPPAPDAYAVAGDLGTALAEVLDRLSATQRAILTLRWTQEMTYEQIAATLSISVAAAKQQVSRAQRLVRPLLVRFLGD